MADAKLQRFLLDHGGAVVVIKSLGTEQISAGTVHPAPGLYSLPTPSKKSLNHRAFKDMLGPCHRMQRHHSPKESCSLAFQEEKTKNVLKIPYSERIVISSSLEISLYFF